MPTERTTKKGAAEVAPDAYRDHAGKIADAEAGDLQSLRELYAEASGWLRLSADNPQPTVQVPQPLADWLSRRLEDVDGAIYHSITHKLDSKATGAYLARALMVQRTVRGPRKSRGAVEDSLQQARDVLHFMLRENLTAGAAAERAAEYRNAKRIEPVTAKQFEAAWAEHRDEIAEGLANNPAFRPPPRRPRRK